MTRVILAALIGAALALPLGSLVTAPTPQLAACPHAWHEPRNPSELALLRKYGEGDLGMEKLAEMRRRRLVSESTARDEVPSLAKSASR